MAQSSQSSLKQHQTMFTGASSSKHTILICSGEYIQKKSSGSGRIGPKLSKGQNFLQKKTFTEESLPEMPLSSHRPSPGCVSKTINFEIALPSVNSSYRSLLDDSMIKVEKNGIKNSINLLREKSRDARRGNPIPAVFI